MASKARNKSLFILAICLTLMAACSSHNGRRLECFEVTNRQLKAIVNTMEQQFFMGNTEDKVAVLDIVQEDSITKFVFSFQNKHRLRDKYIGYKGRRIVGYISQNHRDLIVLTNIKIITELQETLEPLMKPTDKIKNFDFLNTDNQLYYDTETKGWRNLETIYEPILVEYQLKEEHFSQPIMKR
jgi:hypothetical protein